MPARVEPVTEHPIPKTVSEVAKPIVKFLKNDVTISEKTKGYSDGFVMQYRLNKTTENKVLIKAALPILSNKNINYYEVSVADLMAKLNLIVAKKILITDKSERYKTTLVASEWCDDLMADDVQRTAFLKKYDAIRRETSDHDSLDFVDFSSVAIPHLLDLYKKAEESTEKELCKMCVCLLAVGMSDLQLGNNIILNQKGFPVVIDTGFSALEKSENFLDSKWQDCVNILLNYPDPEVQAWGKVIQGYKDYFLEVVEKKVDFANVFVEPKDKSNPSLIGNDFDSIEKAKERFTVSKERLEEIKKSQQNFNKHVAKKLPPNL